MTLVSVLFSAGWRVRLVSVAATVALWLLSVLPNTELQPMAGLATSAHARASGGQSLRFTKGLLWKIESPGRSASYLFGTIHSADPRVTKLPPVVRSAFDRASSFTMEMLINGTGIASMAEAMFFEQGQTLRAVLGNELYSLAEQAMADHGLPTIGLNKKKPWVVIMLLNTPRAEAGLALDMLLQLEATLQGKPTYGLETMEEQIAVFNGMSLDDQVALLKDTVRVREIIARQFESLIRTYRARDLVGLMTLVNGHERFSTPAYQTMLDRLLTRRNEIMLERMRPRLVEGNAFIAVGAAHLPGESGLLQLLQQAGYQISVVY